MTRYKLGKVRRACQLA